MSYVFNMVGGGSGGGGPTSSDAILTVTVPTGSTVTMTKGGVTLTPTMWVQAADATLDCALFVIGSSLFDSQNAWTVTASKNGTTASETVTISSNKQYDLTIELALYFIRNGSEVGTNAFAKKNGSGEKFTVDGNVAYKCTSSSNTVYYTADLVDVSGFSAMTVVIPKASFKYSLRFGLTATKQNIDTSNFNINFEGGVETIGTGSSTVTDITTDTPVNLDLSNVSGSYYLGFSISYGGTSGIASGFGNGGFAVKDYYLH